MNRINQITTLIDNCQCVYDVGSDHALLAIALLKNKQTKKVVNIEINYKPLKAGLINLAKKHLTTKTLNVENNGLRNISKKVRLQPDFICITGLGARTIVDIIESKDPWVNNNATYILEANTDVEVLRKWLAKNKWETLCELTCEDRGKYYQILKVRKGSKEFKLTTFEAYFGSANKQKDKAMWKTYVTKKTKDIVSKKLDKYNKSIAALVDQVKKAFK